MILPNFLVWKFCGKAQFPESFGRITVFTQCRVILSNLNFSSVGNKFDPLSQHLCGNVDLLMVSKTKVDRIVPEWQFHIDDYTSLYRLDQKCNGGDIMTYVRKDIPPKLNEIRNSILGIFIKLTRIRWSESHADQITLTKVLFPKFCIISKNLDNLLTNYDVFLMGDLNVDKNDGSLKGFCQWYNFKHCKTRIIPQSWISCYQILIVTSRTRVQLKQFFFLTVIYFFVLKTNCKNKFNLVSSASFRCKRKVKKRPWNTSNTWLKFAQIEVIFFLHKLRNTWTMTLKKGLLRLQV